jgi:hypothetical protein
MSNYNRSVEPGKVVKFSTGGSDFQGVFLSVKQVGLQDLRANVFCLDGETRQVFIENLKPSRLPNGVSMEHVLNVAALEVTTGDEVLYKGQKCTVLMLLPCEGKLTLSAPWDVKRPYAGTRERTSKSTTTVYADRCERTTA